LNANLARSKKNANLAGSYVAAMSWSTPWNHEHTCRWESHVDDLKNDPLHLSQIHLHDIINFN
jgi:hypothetical protein